MNNLHTNVCDITSLWKTVICMRTDVIYNSIYIYLCYKNKLIYIINVNTKYALLFECDINKMFLIKIIFNKTIT